MVLGPESDCGSDSELLDFDDVDVLVVDAVAESLLFVSGLSDELLPQPAMVSRVIAASNVQNAAVRVEAMLSRIGNSRWDSD